MISYETFCQLRQMFDQKNLSAAQIAAELELDLKTAEKWVKQPTYQARRPVKRPSKLDPFKGQIMAMLERHSYSAQQILQELKLQGYSGAYSILKDFVRLVRPVRKAAYLTLEFAPGECAQADWGSFGSVSVGSTRRRLSFFVMVLCYSRLSYLEFTLGQGMEQFLSCHQNAFSFFGGAPEKVMIDNLKTGVLTHPLGEKAQFHPRYLDFAGHYGFQPIACAVRKPNEKGRVENGVGYVKKNFLSGLQIASFEVLNPAAIHWLRTVANVRIHGETHRKPLDLFEEEKARLKSLPALAYDAAALKPVTASSRCRVIFEANRYSIPHLYASQKLTLKLYPERLCIYHNETLIATHPRSYDRRQDISNPDHTKELLAQRLKARQQTLLLAFLNLTPSAQDYCRKLEEKRLNAPHHIQKIVALSEIYGVDQVARAIADALTFEAYGCEYIANILEQRQRPSVTPTALHLTRRQDLLELEIPAADLTPYHRQ
ncbi:MAG: IS21 family transposase [Acidobacteria bacterium]|nr:MAG: IS21 family transposase [Acidobacteriota bacterium]